MILGTALELLDVTPFASLGEGEGRGVDWPVPLEAFSEEELAYCRAASFAPRLAARAAARLAVLKALELPVTPARLAGIRVVRHPGGQPEAVLSDALWSEVLRSGGPRGGVTPSARGLGDEVDPEGRGGVVQPSMKIWLSLSHSGSLAIALAVVEVLPSSQRGSGSKEK